MKMVWKVTEGEEEEGVVCTEDDKRILMTIWTL